MIDKVLFWIFFLIFLLINTYFYGLFFKNINFIPDHWETSSSFTIIIVLLYFLAVIPFTAYLSERVLQFCQNQRFMNRRILIATLIMIPIMFVSLKLYNEYKEKGLVEAMDYDEDSFEMFIFYPGQNIEWRTTNQDHVDELMDFLSQYDVKRMKQRDWDSDVSNERGVSFDIVNSDRPIMAYIMEERLRINTEYYSLVNGSIDIDWIINFIEENQR
ncbi:hypothetical protein SAMN05216389_103137 [Oceanobacillus limi]|uniref:Uncharacterized protein n=1 Tax=Oceanobacillus limi TaxID=930131 RepID=A0A1I0A9D0_9BACI|nr:hypothetical protein [Oceanobacillus limi]SES90819.1 hypothetical protein SAMN05216389_103137 [Oceanobacillus limi]